MAKENNLRWMSLEELFEAVSAFLNPVLRGEDGIWDPDTWSWPGGASP